MNRHNEMDDREMERLLEQHLASAAPPAPDLWATIESRLGEQAPKPIWAVLRDAATPVDGFPAAPAFAATAAAAAVIVVAGSALWITAGSGGSGNGGIPASGEPTRTPFPAATPTPTSLPVGAPAPTPTPIPPGVTAVPHQPAPTAAPQAHGYPTPTPPPPGMHRPPTATPALALTPAGPDRPTDTTFGDYDRQPLTDARENAVSTFSLDADRTSFQLALNWARDGYEVDPASVRAEEWVNAFDYGYAPPAASDRFAITSDLIAHPLDEGRRLARVAFKAPEVVADGPLNVTLVLDASGSMKTGNRVDVARAAAEAIRRSLDADDRISVVHFTERVIDARTVRNARPGDRAVAASISRLAPHGSTNVQAGLDLGVQLADAMRRERPHALNYVILMSDGVANVDATDPFGILAATSAPDGANPIRLVTVGVGIENYNDQLLEQLAQHGNGWYRYLFDEEQARATFRRDNWLALSSPVADQTRAQITWNTDAVRAWRIVGYENRVTSAESFTQDRKEFAEIYSGAATTVFYELELRDGVAGQGPLGEVELRWVEPETGRGWSQLADVVSSGETRPAHEDPLLLFGAVVALAADRYAALDDGERHARSARDLWTLQGIVDGLQGALGGRAAFRDFAFVLEALRRSVPYSPHDDSGYSR